MPSVALTLTRSTHKGLLNKLPEAERAAVREQRVEDVRKLMILHHSDGDIKRMLAVKWDVKPRYVERYLCVARARNREALGRDEVACRADSIGWWTEKLSEKEAQLRAAQVDFNNATITADRARRAIQSKEGDWEEAKKALREANNLKKRARYVMREIEPLLIQYQNAIDRLLGNHAPVKVAQTTKDGKDVAKPAEPVDPAKEIDDLFRSLGERCGVPTETMPQQGTVSGNGVNGHAQVNGNGHRADGSGENGKH
ncbi:MAG: hypothetical protein IT428_19905 [Planctomycetaceae bacterium]|nr:hypothetical protein [Planctomycetaceae bacterium]